VPATLGDAVDDADRQQAELRWLALNRQQYAGRWVALDGSDLLAVGDSAKEVFEAVASCKRTPLVTRVEHQHEVYFAGW
jgi:hypothetical protein